MQTGLEIGSRSAFVIGVLPLALGGLFSDGYVFTFVLQSATEDQVPEIEAVELRVSEL